MYECYDEIVGYTQTDCVCMQSGRPANYNVSNSGLFIDELANISTVMSSCDATNWDRLTQGLEVAKKLFVADTNAMLLANKFKLKRKPVKSQVLGQIKATSTIATPTKNYNVTRLACSPIRGGIGMLKTIGGVFSANGTVSIELHNNVDGLLSTHVLTTVANKHSTLDVNIELPLYSKYVDVLEYYLVYAFDLGNLAKDTKLSCGCGGMSLDFDLDRPYFYDPKFNHSAPWTQYIMLGTTQIDSIANELQGLYLVANSTNMNGITVEMDFYCKIGEVICEDYFDFKGNPLALCSALAIQYAWGAQIANTILSSTELARASLVNSDVWEHNLNTWTENYIKQVEHIVAKVDHTANDCLACSNLNSLTTQGLFA